MDRRGFSGIDKLSIEGVATQLTLGEDRVSIQTLSVVFFSLLSIQKYYFLLIPNATLRIIVRMTMEKILHKKKFLETE